MSSTLFAYLKGAISENDDTDPETSSFVYNQPMEAYHNVTAFRRETLELDDGDTRTMSFPVSSAASGWVGVMARVIGEAKLTTVGVNYDGTTAITGVTVGYGVDRYPGALSFVTTNVTSYTFEGLADGTKVEYVAMILSADDDL